MIPHDYHIHTNFSCDSEATMLEMCHAAIEKGLPEIGISDHLDFHPEDVCCDYFQADAWWEELERCRRACNGSVIIRAGIEIGESHRFTDTIRPILEQYPWDYCLGSLHWVGERCVFDRQYFDRDAAVTYQEYFLELANMVTEGDFDILAHMDVVKRYGYDVYGSYDPYRWEDEIRAVLRICAQRDIALELNTATLRRPVAELTPDAPILAWFKEEGGKWLTLGSDAHRPDHIGFELDQCVAKIREAGFDCLVRFESRRLQALTLEKPGT